MIQPSPSKNIEVAAFYEFAPLPRFQALHAEIQTLCDAHGVKGILLLAAEGINGTLAGVSAELAQVLASIRQMTGLEQLQHKTSFADEMPFLRMKVRTKREIVTIGDDRVNPLQQVGIYVEAKDWNALISDPDVKLIDTRNSFEHKIGTFKRAEDAETTAFIEFPEYVHQKLDPKRHKKVAMFCTGGIRCEKASSFMLSQGFEEVYHLKGGILSYLEQVSAEDSLWSGGCFVFDRRVALGHGLVVQPVRLCLNCATMIDGAQLQSPLYEEGVCCSSCTDILTDAQKASSRERQRQVILAEAKGQSHLGPWRPSVTSRAPSKRQN